MEEQDEEGTTQTSLFEATQIPGFYTLEEGDGITDESTNQDGDVVNEDDTTADDDVVDNGDTDTGDDVTDPTAGSADDFNAWLAMINEANSDNAYSLLAGFDPVRLSFDNNQIQDLEKFDDGDWDMQEHTEENQAFINQSGLLVREEMEDNGLETTFYQDADNDGIYFAIEQQFEEGGALTDASDQSVAVTMSDDTVTDPNTDTTELAGVAPTPSDDFIA